MFNKFIYYYLYKKVSHLFVSYEYCLYICEINTNYMNPKNYIKVSEFIKKFTVDNLSEYKDCQLWKLSETTDEFEIKRIKNLIIVIDEEIKSRINKNM